jgi:lipopolysaccharide transport protein LptA
MRWSDAARTAAFEGDVAARRGLQTARGDRGECRLDAAGRIERTVLEGNVAFEDRGTGRQGSGTRAVDDPASGVTNLAGDPAVAQDAQGNRVQGAVLTFRKESGSVEVKAKEGGRVESVYQTHGS